MEQRTARAKRVRYLTRLSKVEGLTDAERARLQAVESRYVFRATDYYLDLIDWSDPEDPLRQLVVPRPDELADWGELDASNEKAVTVARGAQHKYRDTVLLLCNEVCGAYCRYCFRKRLFMNDNDEATIDVSEGIDYIRRHPEVTNVLLTGGDPLLMAPHKLLGIIRQLREIDHVRIIRIGSKMPAFNPWVILDRPELVEGLARYSRPDRRIYLMTHFDHPRELTEPAIAAVDTLIRSGVICANQCPMIRGVNDSVDTLTELYRKLSFIGAPPYYLFQGRPTAGNEPYETPLTETWRIFDEARQRVSGLAARVRMAMSHSTGKIEVLGVDARHIYMRYHRAKRVEDQGRFMIFKRDDDAFWLDQLEPVGEGLRDRPERRRGLADRALRLDA